MVKYNSYSAEILGLVLALILFILFKSFRVLFEANEIETEIKLAKRSSNIDFVRGISIIGIVMIHVDSYYRYYHPNDHWSDITLILSNFSRFSVPIFIITSAFFLNYKSKKDYWLSKWKNLIIPYLIIGTIAYIIKYPIKSENFVFDYLFKLFSGTIMAPYYFVPLMIQCYIIYGFLIRKIEKDRKYLIILLIFSLILNLFSNGDFIKIQNIYLYALSPAFFGNFIFFFLIGITSKNIFKNPNLFEKYVYFQPKFIWGLFFCLLIYLTLVCSLSIQRTGELSNHFLFYPLGIFIILFMAGYFLENSSRFVYNKIHLIFSLLGKKSISIFLIHPILIHFIFGLDPHIFGGQVFGYFIIIILNITAPILIWEVYEKIKTALLS